MLSRTPPEYRLRLRGRIGRFEALFAFGRYVLELALVSGNHVR